MTAQPAPPELASQALPESRGPQEPPERLEPPALLVQASPELLALQERKARQVLMAQRALVLPAQQVL